MDHYCENLTRLRGIATQHGLHMTSDDARVEKVVGLMTRNYDAVGEWICPCKQKTKPAVAGTDITCPCPTLDAEVAATGTCFCRLFVK